MKEIPGFAGYYATEDGQIYSTRSKGGIWRNRPRPTTALHLRKPQIVRGYRMVGLGVGLSHKPTMVKIARLVLLTFVGEPPKDHVACHGVRGRLDDSVNNLSWGTQKKNCTLDKARDGTTQNGERSPNHKLSDKKVKYILSMRNRMSSKMMADRLGVYISTVQKVLARQTWKHIFSGE